MIGDLQLFVYLGVVGEAELECDSGQAKELGPEGASEVQVPVAMDYGRT